MNSNTSEVHRCYVYLNNNVHEHYDGIEKQFKKVEMPIISRFLGIIIAMYWDDHSPPHFHAKYSEYEITVEILTGTVEGKFPKRALHHILEWYELHKDELIDNWTRCNNKEEPNQIDPLE